MSLFNNIYKNKRVLVTGNTGFKGAWLSAWLIKLGAEVFGISKGIPTTPSLFFSMELNTRVTYVEMDILDFGALSQKINEIKPDFLFHLAAQALVKISYSEPINTVQTNVVGTANVLEALRLSGHPCSAIIITSDKCYENIEWDWGYRENDRLGGKDPYSASKGAAELIIRTYAHSYFASPESPVKIAVGRAGNVIGGGDWALDRILPDCVKAWGQNKMVKIRNPQATRPWQHVLEPLSGYLTLGNALNNDLTLNGEAFNFGPSTEQSYTVQELIEAMGKRWGSVQWRDISEECDKFHEAGLLKLCCDKALHKLHWGPVLDFRETVRMSVDWYRNFYEKDTEDYYSFTLNQIEYYVELARARKKQWTL